MSAWGLSDAHVQLAVPLPEIDGDTLPTLSIEQEWQMLETHFLGLIALVSPSRRLNELRRLFDQGLAERFRGQGIEAAFDQPDHALRRRAVVVRQRVENSLWTTGARAAARCTTAGNCWPACSRTWPTGSSRCARSSTVWRRRPPC